jgi:hypothetical protein
MISLSFYLLLRKWTEYSDSVYSEVIGVGVSPIRLGLVYPTI